MITPQPQPAAYWIALLDELTDGWFSEATNDVEINEGIYESVTDFLNGGFTWNEQELGFAFWNSFIDGIDGIEYVCTGKSVIDAAVELEDPKNDNVKVEEIIALYGRLEKQVQLYKRCNGIKD